jgi:hypothetical protein
VKFNYLPISLTYNTLDEINVEALFAEMTKEIIRDYGSFSKSEFSITSGFEIFILKKGSAISNQLLANPTEAIELNLSDFKAGTLNSEDGTKSVYYHLDIMKEFIKDNWQKNFQYTDTLFYSTQCRVCMTQTDMVNKLNIQEIGSDKRLSDYSLWKYINFKKITSCSCGAKNFEIVLGKFYNGNIIPYFESSNLKLDDVPNKGYLELFVDKKDNKIAVEISKSNSVTNSIFSKLLNTVEKVTRFLDDAFDYHSMITNRDDGHYYVLITFELTETTSAENKIVRTISSRVEKLSYLGFDPTDIRMVNRSIFRLPH